MNTKNLKAYLLARAQEASTWRGVVLVLTAAGIVLRPELQELIVTAGLGLAGLVGAAFPDAKKGEGDQ